MPGSKRILVTGGAGYIGSHALRELARAGWEPIVYDNLSNGHRWAADGSTFVEGDLADRDLLRRTLRDAAAVVHFAASAYVGESVTNPRKYYENNVANSLTLLGAMLDEGVKTIVFSSSCATYGIPRNVPVPEDEPQAPINPYGQSKLFVEQTLREYGRAYGLQWAALRYFNAAGADASGEIGERHEPETHLVPLIVYAALGVYPSIKVFGTDYLTPDGTAIRDYIHVTDLGLAHTAALRYLLDGGAPIALNLGTGHGHSVREVIHAVERVSGRSVPVVEAPRREGDPPALVSNPAKAQALLGWHAAHSSLENIVGTAWRWHSKENR